MIDAVLAVTRVGPLVTLQDAGRPGLMRFGVPASGPMDRQAFALAHAALGRPAGGVAVEVSLGGLELVCESGAVSVAVAGGGFRVEADGAVSPSWAVRVLERGSTLRVGAGPWGSWTYLAFAGDLAAEMWLGSAATHLPSGLGGGRLAAGQRLLVGKARVLGPPRAIPIPVSARARARVRVVVGPQQRFFAPATLDRFLSGRFTLTAAADRMGVRLAGPALAPVGPLTMPSEPVVRGAVQVGGDGVATVLLADHQTTGGYPKIATVVGGDLDGFAQLRPRDAVTFAALEADAAIRLARTRQASWARTLAGVRAGAAEPA